MSYVCEHCRSTVVSAPTHLRSKDNDIVATPKAAEHHSKAAEHHNKAAEHHTAAAEHHTAGDAEKAGHHAHIARGHEAHAESIRKRRASLTPPTTRRQRKAVPKSKMLQGTARLPRVVSTAKTHRRRLSEPLEQELRLRT